MRLPRVLLFVLGTSRVNTSWDLVNIYYVDSIVKHFLKHSVCIHRAQGQSSLHSKEGDRTKVPV